MTLLERARHAGGVAALDRRGAGGDRPARRADRAARPELRPLARADARVMLLDTIPGIGELLGLTLASEIGDVARFGSPRKLIGYAGLAPRINQSGDRSRTGALSKAGSRTLRWAAVEAAQHAWRPTNPWHQLYIDLAKRHGKNPAKAAVARKILIAAWHVLSRQQPFKPAAPAAAPRLSRQAPDASGRLTALHGIEKPRQLPRTLCEDPSAEREMSPPHTPGARGQRPSPVATRPTTADGPLDNGGRLKEKAMAAASTADCDEGRSASEPIARRQAPGRRPERSSRWRAPRYLLAHRSRGAGHVRKLSFSTSEESVSGSGDAALRHQRGLADACLAADDQKGALTSAQRSSAGLALLNWRRAGGPATTASPETPPGWAGSPRGTRAHADDTTTCLTSAI